LRMSAESDVRPPAGDDLNGQPHSRRGRPRQSTPDQIRARQGILRSLPHWDSQNDFVFDLPSSFDVTNVVETLTAHVVLPVSVVGPLRLTSGAYHVDEMGRLIEEGRHTEEVYVPLAHTEGGLSASMQRGIAAVLASGSVQTFVIHDRMTRDSCFSFETTEQAVICARWVAAHVAE